MTVVLGAQELGKSWWDMGWVKVALSCDVQVNEIALQDSVGTCVENRNKNAGDDVCRGEDYQHWKELGLDILLHV